MRWGVLMMSLGAACDPEVRWVDPAYTLAAEVAPTLGAVVLGEGEGAAFVPYSDEAPIAVVEGLQGGLWAMPTLRIESLAGTARVRCTLQDADTGLGSSEAVVPTRPTRPSALAASGPGWVEVARFPIAVRAVAATATLECEVSAAGAMASVAHTAALSVP